MLALRGSVALRRILVGLDPEAWASVSEVRVEEGAVLTCGMGESVEARELPGEECDDADSGASMMKDNW